MSNAANQTKGGQAELKEDLVCGMRISADAPLRLEHEGQLYVFCSTSCLRRFQDDPRGFVDRRSARPDAGARVR
jgi:Cu+-exporting ATPase